MRRRAFLKTLGYAGSASLLGGPATASPAAPDTEEEFVGVLVDIAKCTGCRKCEEACADENGLILPDIKDKAVFESKRQTDPDHWTVVNRFEANTAKGELFVKTQCMHCNQPGCASACLCQAMDKKKTGPIVWHADKCMGCRFCMVSCPFDIPKFEYFSANPKIQKCILCYDRLQEGKVPSCVEGCPVEALTFGTRRELLEIARTRIYTNPDQYVHQVFGEHIVGGTGWLYLSPVPFEELGFRTNLGNTPYPDLSKEFLYAVPLVLLLWPGFLFGASQALKGKEEDEKAKEIQGGTGE